MPEDVFSDGTSCGDEITPRCQFTLSAGETLVDIQLGTFGRTSHTAGTAVTITIEVPLGSASLVELGMPSSLEITA